MSNTGLFIITLILFLCMPLASGCQQTPPPPPSELKVELLGDSHTLLVDSEGKLTASAELISDDGSICLTIAKGTRILDKDKNTLQLIQVEIDPTLPLSPEDAYIIGAVYDLKPYGATFSFPLQLTLKYNADELPHGAKESTICIASYENNKWSVVSLQKTDTKTQMITAQISHLVRAGVIVSQELPSTETFPKPPTTSASISPLVQALSNGKPTLTEFGSSTCIPCKQMKPILDELAIEYEGKVNVVIIEVYEQMALTRQHSIMAIPTQIIFDSNGKEITRHMGFWAKKDIISQLNKMGVE